MLNFDRRGKHWTLQRTLCFPIFGLFKPVKVLLVFLKLTL